MTLSNEWQLLHSRTIPTYWHRHDTMFHFHLQQLMCFCVPPPAPLVHREQPGSDQTSTDLLKCSRKFRWSKEAQYLYLRRLSSRSYSAIMMVRSYVMSNPNVFPSFKKCNIRPPNLDILMCFVTTLITLIVLFAHSF